MIEGSAGATAGAAFPALGPALDDPASPSGHVFIATSLDGHIARHDGSIDWLETAGAAGEDHGYGSFIAGMDAIVMGRATWETVNRFETWPYAIPVLVLSSTLSPAVLDAAQAAVVRSPAAALTEARRRGWRNLYVDGGATIRAFLTSGSIASMTISRLPILLGGGRPLFGDLPCEIRWQHLETRSFPSGLVQSRYALRTAGDR